jgi:uncharacterized membrane protein YkoI
MRIRIRFGGGNKMRKKWMIGIISGGLLLGGGFALAASPFGNNLSAKVEAKEVLPMEKISKTVLDKYGGQIEDMELDQGYLGTYYEIELFNDKEEVDLTVDAYSGKVVFERKIPRFFDDDYMGPSNSIKGQTNNTTNENTQARQVNTDTANSNNTATENAQTRQVNTDTANSNNAATPTTANKATITQEQAIAIAEKETGAKATSIHQDFDDGYLQYEVDLISGTNKFDVTINAETGAIMEYDVESIYND